jgi:hypothetical protein
MRLARSRLLALALGVCLALAGVALGYNLTLSSARRHAASSVALIARYVPRTTGYRLSGCKRYHGRQVRCTYQLFIRALSGGTITCTSQIVVGTATVRVAHGRRAHRVVQPVSSFPVTPTCVRKP